MAKLLVPVHSHYSALDSKVGLLEPMLLSPWLLPRADMYPQGRLWNTLLISFVDHDGYSISSEGFLPTVVDIVVI